jgi:hypothetical protein
MRMWRGTRVTMPPETLRWTDAAGPRDIPVRPGQTVAAALAAAGVRELRQTRRGLDGEGRGIFCGMGVCQDCLVTVDGAPNSRACMTKAAPGMVVAWQEFPGAPMPPAATAPPEDVPLTTEAVDLLILGGGAGGLSAAIAARRCGFSVLLVEERPKLGGQYYKQAASDAAPLDPQQAEGAALAARAEASGAAILRGAELWGAFGMDRLAVFDGRRSRLLAPRAVIVAAGAYERPHVVPGWTLPGVMTVARRRRCGAATACWQGGACWWRATARSTCRSRWSLPKPAPRSVAVAEAAPPPATRWRDAIAMAAADPGLAAKGVRYLAALRRRRIPLLHGTMLLRIGPRGRGALQAACRARAARRSWPPTPSCSATASCRATRCCGRSAPSAASMRRAGRSP